jgi:MarR family 2-MHQ and catechol resistance regulon transcriptional repressor
MTPKSELRASAEPKPVKAKAAKQAKAKSKEKPKDKPLRRTRRALDAYARMQRAATLAAEAADASLAPFGLSASQYGVLEALAVRGPLHQQELARAADRSKAQMTAIIDALEARGVVVRERHPTDRRYTSVRITESGTALLAEVVPARTAAVVTLMGALSGDQRTRLGRLCRRLVNALAPGEAQPEEDAGEDAERSGATANDEPGTDETEVAAAPDGAQPEVGAPCGDAPDAAVPPAE